MKTPLKSFTQSLLSVPVLLPFFFRGWKIRFFLFTRFDRIPVTCIVDELDEPVKPSFLSHSWIRLNFSQLSVRGVEESHFNMVESSLKDIYNELKQALSTTFEESKRRHEKAEMEAMEAICKAAGRLDEEMRHRNGIKHKFTKGIDELNNAEVRLEMLLQELNEANDQKKTLENKIENLNVRNKALEEKTSKLLQNHKEKDDALQAELINEKKELKNAKDHLDYLSHELNEVNEEKSLLENRIENLNVRNKALEEKISILLQKHKDTADALLEELANGKEELNNVRGQFDSLSHELDEANDEKKSLENKVEYLSGRNKALEEKISKLLQKHKEKGDALLAELANGKEDLKNAKGQSDTLLRELNEANDKKKSLESIIENLNVRNRVLEAKILKLLQKHREKGDALQADRDKALQEAECLKKELEEGSSSSSIPTFFFQFSYSDIKKATNYFSPSLKIREGGYGRIYRGFLCETEVTIKMLDPESRQGPRQFQQEVDALSKLRHPNVVTLIGACPESLALVYEHLGGGSLEDRLNCKDNSPPLPWQTRVHIAADLCSALIFLHTSQPNSVIHGDLNPSNMLLCDNSVCKLSDFGICSVIPRGETLIKEPMSFLTNFSYTDPEFLATGELTIESDVYSFGVILLCLLTGKTVLNMADEVQEALSNNNLMSIVDPLAGEWPYVQVERLARLALWCCNRYRIDRPDLTSEVWKVLKPMKGSCQSLAKLGCDEAPSYFLCPILYEVMKDPQFAADGFTYDAEAIKSWLDGHNTSPLTNERLENTTLIPNHSLRSAIREWQQHYHVNE